MKKQKTLQPLPTRKDFKINKISNNLIHESLKAQEKKILPRIEDDTEKAKIRLRFWKKKPVIVGVYEKKKYQRLGYFNKRRLKRHPATSFLIRMKFSNGTSKEFVISTRKETFTYMKKTYYLRYEDAWFNLTQNQYELDFFDDHPVPLDREVQKRGDKAYWSVTSDNLKPLIEMEYIKALASSADIDKYLKMNATISVFIIFMLLVIMYFMFKLNRGVTLLLGA